ncbi:unnamed protein product [Soboliphyme baturini]|uniref:Titin n=1 Tax=Soboliphyme baturini TaxID=241478 RepID=A0A183IHB8_9BILA|nr:unnamed protein product [Soboliphyme baturini]
MSNIDQQLPEIDEKLASMKTQVDEIVGDVENLSVDYAEILSPDEFHDLLSSRDQLLENYSAIQCQVKSLVETLVPTVDLRQRLDSQESACFMCLDEVQRFADEQDIGPLEALPSKLASLQETLEKIKEKRTQMTKFNDFAKEYESALKEYLVEMNVVRKLSGSLEPVNYSNYLCVEKLTCDLSRKYDAAAAKAAQHISVIKTLSEAYDRLHRANDSCEECVANLEAAVSNKVSDGHRVRNLADIAVEMESLNTMRSDVDNKKHIVESFLNVSSDVIRTLQSVPIVSSSEIESVRMVSDRIKKRYEESVDKLNDYMTVVKARLVKSEDTRKSIDSIEQSLEMTCHAISDLQSGSVISPTHLSEQLTEKCRVFTQLQECRSGIDAIEESLRKLCDREKSSGSDALVREAQMRLKSLRDHYDRAVKSFKAVDSDLQQAQNRVGKFQETVKCCSSFLDSIEHSLASAEQSNDELSARAAALDKLKVDLAVHSADFRLLEESFADALKIVHLAPSYIASCKNDKEAVLSRLESVNACLDQQSRSIDQQQQQAVQYEAAFDNVRRQLEQLQSRADHLTPSSLSGPVLERQIEEVNTLLEIHHTIGSQNLDLQKLLPSCDISAVPPNAAQQLEALTKQYEQVGSTLMEASSRLQKTTSQLTDYKTHYEQVFQSVSEVLTKIKSVAFCTDKEATASSMDSIKVPVSY